MRIFILTVFCAAHEYFVWRFLKLAICADRANLDEGSGRLAFDCRDLGLMGF